MKQTPVRKAFKELTGQDAPDPENNREILYLIILILFSLILLFWFLTPVKAHADTIPKDKAILSIIGEAENQGGEGMLAVACGIRNRGTLHGVYGLNAPRVKHNLYTKEIYLRAKLAWELANDNSLGDNCTFLDGANSWENLKAFGKPYWADTCQQKYIWKDHVFFKCPKT